VGVGSIVAATRVTRRVSLAADARKLPDVFTERYGSTASGDRGGVMMPAPTFTAAAGSGPVHVVQVSESPCEVPIVGAEAILHSVNLL
jgi:hypothetical protein